MTTINEQNIRSYLERGESQTLEYKSGTSSLDAICKVVASFANAEGGILILGFVEPKGIVGVLPDRKLSTIDHAISHLNSLPTFTSYKVACDDKELIIIEEKIKTHSPFLEIHFILELAMRAFQCELLILKKRVNKHPKRFNP